MITRSRIAKYWFDKGIDRNTFEIVCVTNHMDFGEVEMVVLDWGEPECWACGKPFIEELSEEDLSISKIWNTCKLERCHIIAKQFGGSDEAANLFLLCPRCHLESPDTRKPENFYAWIVNKRMKGGYIQDIADGIKEAAEMKHIDYIQLSEKIAEKKLLLDADSHLQIAKRLVKNCGFHGARVVDSTLFMNLIDEIMRAEKQ